MANKTATMAPQSAYQRALARAKAQKIQVTGYVWEPGRKEFTVTASGGEGAYTVRVHGMYTSCNCPDKNGTYCKHRALVRAILIEQSPRCVAVDADADQVQGDRDIPVQPPQGPRLYMV